MKSAVLRNKESLGKSLWTAIWGPLGEESLRWGPLSEVLRERFGAYEPLDNLTSQMGEFLLEVLEDELVDPLRLEIGVLPFEALPGIGGLA